MIVNMDNKMTRIALLMVLFVYITFVEAWTELHRSETGVESDEGSDIEIVCESDLRRLGGMDDDDLKQQIRWLRGGPVVEDLKIVASTDGRVSIKTEILPDTETTSGNVDVMSTLVIRGVTLEDATNYTCCKMDTPMCDTWVGRQQRQLQLTILQTQTVTVPPASTDKQTTMTTSSHGWITNNPLELSTLSTVFGSVIQEHSVIPTDNQAFRQKRVVYTIAVPCVLAVILIIVVIFVARYQWRRKNLDTPVQVFEA